MSRWDALSGLIDPARLEARLRELVAIASVNPFGRRAGPGEGERDVADWLATELSGLGCEPTTQVLGPRRANVLGAIGGGDGPSLMLAGHMDTVPDAVTAPQNTPAGVVYGRGACDMKAALACYLEVAHVLRDTDTDLSGTLWIAAVADEEFEQRGAKHLAQHGPRADGVVIGEPTSLTVCPATMGLLSLRVTTHGQATHGGVADQGDNAIYAIGPVLLALQEYANRLATAEATDPLLGTPRMNVGTIEGGVQANTVPDSCHIELSRRLLPAERQAEVVTELEQIVVAAGPMGRTDLSEPLWQVDPYALDPGHVLVRSVESAVQAATGSATIRGFPASSDAPYFGMPTVLCGPGELAHAHAREEHVTTEQLVLATRAYLHLALELR